MFMKRAHRINLQQVPLQSLTEPSTQKTTQTDQIRLANKREKKKATAPNSRIPPALGASEDISLPAELPAHSCNFRLTGRPPAGSLPRRDRHTPYFANFTEPVARFRRAQSILYAHADALTLPRGGAGGSMYTPPFVRERGHAGSGPVSRPTARCCLLASARINITYLLLALEEQYDEGAGMRCFFPSFAGIPFRLGLINASAGRGEMVLLIVPRGMIWCFLIGYWWLVFHWRGDKCYHKIIQGSIER